MLDEQYEKELLEITRERLTKERRAAGLIRRRHSKRDSTTDANQQPIANEPLTPHNGDPTAKI
jgi:hypothetical protein